MNRSPRSGGRSPRPSKNPNDAAKLVVTVVDYRSDAANVAARTASDEQLGLGVLEEGILPGQDLPDLAAQRGDPERIAAVDGVRDTEKPAEAGAITGQRFHMTHDESSSSLELLPASSDPDTASFLVRENISTHPQPHSSPP